MFGFSKWDIQDQQDWMRKVAIGAVIAISVISVPAAIYTIVSPVIESAQAGAASEPSDMQDTARKHQSIGTLADEQVTCDAQGIVVTGRVLDGNGEAVTGAEIAYEVYDKSGNACDQAKTTTDGEGRYKAVISDGASSSAVYGFTCLDADGMDAASAASLLDQIRSIQLTEKVGA